jgi:hypothetical protein
MAARDVAASGWVRPGTPVPGAKRPSPEEIQRRRSEVAAVRKNPEALRQIRQGLQLRIGVERKLRQSRMRPSRVVRYFEGQPPPDQLKAIEESSRRHFGKLVGGAEVVVKTPERVVAVFRVAPQRVAPQRTVARPANTSRPRSAPRGQRAPASRKTSASGSDDPHLPDLALGARQFGLLGVLTGAPQAPRATGADK